MRIILDYRTGASAPPAVLQQQLERARDRGARLVVLPVGHADLFERAGQAQRLRDVRRIARITSVDDATLTVIAQSCGVPLLPGVRVTEVSLRTRLPVRRVRACQPLSARGTRCVNLVARCSTGTRFAVDATVLPLRQAC